MLISDGTIRGKIEPISAVIRQEINGEYSCDVEIALSDNLAEYFDIDAIVYLDDANGTVQQFRLERPTKTLDSLRAFGWHISQDLAHDMILNDAWITQTGSAVLPDLLQSGISETRFTGTSDITTENSLRIVRSSVLNALIGDQDNSFINRFGGEIERDNFTVNMLSRLGAERGYRIAYKKNLTGIEIIDDASTIVNRIVPTFLNASDAAVLLPETYIDSVRIGDTAIPHVRSIHYGDIKVGEEVDGVVPYPTLASAYSEVRDRVAAMYDAGIDRPALTVDVQFVQLRNTLEYADFAMLETVLLGDTIRADYEDYTVTNRVVAYEWDAVLKRYNKIILGTVRPSVDAMTASIATQVAESVDINVRERLVSSIVSELVKINEHINGSMGYYSTTVTNADGSIYTYLHDEETLEASLYISYVPEPGSYVWTDTGWNSGNPSWNYGYTQDGNAVFRLLSTVGINADWINAGSINTDVIYVGSETLTTALANMQTQISELASGSGNFIRNSNFGTYENPYDTFWGEGLTWDLLESRNMDWDTLEASITDWNEFESGDF
jgi:phage minor structural protein